VYGSSQITSVTSIIPRSIVELEGLLEHVFRDRTYKLEVAEIGRCEAGGLEKVGSCERLVDPARNVFAFLQAFGAVLCLRGLVGGLRCSGLASGNSALDGRDKHLATFRSALVHIAHTRPKSFVGFGIFELERLHFFERDHRDSCMDVAKDLAQYHRVDPVAELRKPLVKAPPERNPPAG
jgi:hypothetical protein